MYKDILIGFALAVLISMVGSILYIKAVLPANELQETIAKLYQGGLVTKVIALGTIPNVFVFQFLIKRNQIYKARGILLAVLLVALAFAYVKLT
ncbi:hypothetical protein [Wenyingzhuangia sp. IMCC45574]